ncbi:undecaprenyl/decaprenyl-phosphate alpha-N-acetylglucosaminyl 1-phosphate transferase [Pseudonocardiaceae bacterium YIM PH 21723]|nr:undecaprenyl/decaprenyl-phosphate alpha-N-acetylglucosaminyl 1-phosphate transferase [Pseudonocardiaceae bacterium YIM PH 21723]
MTGAVRLFAFKVGAVAVPRARDVHAKPMARMGGLAIFGGVLAGMFLAHQLPVLRSAFAFEQTQVRGVVMAGAIIVLIGALDDRFELDGLTKLAGQTTAAGVMVLFGVQWSVFWVPWGSPVGSSLVLGSDQGSLLTVLLTVTMINAMNFVDGLDGLASGIGMISACATCVFSLSLLNTSGAITAYPPTLIAATLAGACLGFLPHNFQPARIFMGDSGSMLIGLMLAAASTTASGQLNPDTTGPQDTLGLLTPLVVVAAVLFIPLLDLILAIIRRTRNGQNLFSADKMHLHHRLLDIGHSHRRAVLLIYLWASVLAFGAVAMAVFDPVVVAWTVGIGLAMALIVSVVPRLRSKDSIPD